MSDVGTLRDRLLAELSALSDRLRTERAALRDRPLSDLAPPEAMYALADDALATVARVEHYDQQYKAGVRTVAQLAWPKNQPLPTAEALAVWLLEHPKHLPLAAAVAEAALLTPEDAHTDHERDAHRVAERWLRDFCKPYAPVPGDTEWWTLWLGFEQPEPKRVPVLPLVAYEQEGGVSMTKGLGAAHAIRLYVEALLAVPPELRRVGHGPPASLYARLRNVVAGLWPRGWQCSRDWPRLLAGFAELRRLGVKWEHDGAGGVWFAVTVRTVPRDAQLDDLVRFEVLLPPGSRPGPMVSRAHLRLLGLDSAPAYRLYLSLLVVGPPRHRWRAADRRRPADTEGAGRGCQRRRALGQPGGAAPLPGALARPPGADGLCDCRLGRRR